MIGEASWVIPSWRPAGTPPLPHPRAWGRGAACVGEPGDWFASGSTDVSGEKAVCWTCPVRRACLAYALDAGESFGIWGGLTAKERAVLVRRLQHGAAAATTSLVA